MRLLSDILAIHPGDRRADRNGERMGMKGEISDRDDEMQRIDHRDRHPAFRWASHRTRASLREAREGDCAPHRAEYHDEAFHGCLTTTSAFMNGCGVQWKADSPGCGNLGLPDLPGSTGPESHEPSSAAIVWAGWALMGSQAAGPVAA